jgi:hypothetical protein
MKKKAPWDKRGGRSAVGPALIIGVSAIFIGIAIWAFLKTASAPRVDRVTNCQIDKLPSVTAVLLDVTDPLTPIQAAAVSSALTAIRDAIPKYGRLEIYPLQPVRQSVIAPIFSGCSPGKSADMTKVVTDKPNNITENPDLADRNWKRLFGDKIDAAIHNTSTLSPANESPLLEGIQSVAVTAFSSSLAQQATTEKTLIIVSDMIHHTTDLSMYGGAPQFQTFAKTPYWARVRSSLGDVHVKVLLLVRDTRRNVQQPPLLDFWASYAAAGGGSLDHWKPAQ